MKILKRNQIIISVLALMLITVGYMSFTSNMTSTLEAGALMDSETMAGIGDAKLVNSDNAVENEKESSNSAIVPNLEENTKEEESDNNSNSTKIETAESAVNSDNKEKSNNTSASSTSTKNEPTSSSKTNSGSKESTPSSKTTKETSTINTSTDYFVSSKLERDKMYSQMLETYQKLLESSTISAEQKNISTQEIANINNQKNSIMIAENLIKNLGFEDVVIFVNYNSTSVIIKADKLAESDVAQIQNIVCREIGVEVETIHISLK